MYARPRQVAETASLLLLKARWERSAFHWYNHLATVFVPFTSLEDILARVEAPTKFTQQVVHDSQQIPSLLNTEMPLL